MKPLVSIITPTYNLISNNRENSFQIAVNSVLDQTYQHIEHIIIDNNSNDGTKKILKNLQHKSKKIKIYSEEDNGIFDAFNKGILKAHGKYIIFLNSDDLYHSKYGIEKCVEILEKTNAGYCFSDCNFINNNQLFNWDTNIYNIFRALPFCHQTMMCRKDILEKYKFNTNYKLIADYDLILRLFIDKIPYTQLNYNFVTFKLGGVSNQAENLQKNSQEAKNIYKEVYKKFYNLSDEELEYNANTSLFPDKLEEIFLEYFDDKELFIEAREELYALKLNQIPKNKLCIDILKRKTDDNIEKLYTFVNNFKPMFSNIYKYLYKKLDNEDKKLFIDFLIKKYADIDTINTDEKLYLDKIFDETQNLYQKRNSTDDLIPVNIDNKTASIISPTPIYNESITKDVQLLKYYEYVHSFILKEYIMNGFEPKENSYIFDCGSSIGDTTILFKLMYPSSPVISIESDKETYKYLLKNIGINNYTDVKAINKFLSNTNDNEKTTIDKIVESNNIKNVGLLKFDIEGGERYAIAGAKETIREFKPNLIIPIYHLQDDCWQIPRLLEKFNMPMTFKLKWVEKRIWGMDCSLFVKFTDE